MNTMYEQLVGTDRVGTPVYTIAELRLSDTALSLTDGRTPTDVFGIEIPAGTKGNIQEIQAGAYKLNFLFKSRYDHEVEQAIFMVKKRDFERLFRK